MTMTLVATISSPAKVGFMWHQTMIGMITDNVRYSFDDKKFLTQ